MDNHLQLGIVTLLLSLDNTS